MGLKDKYIIKRISRNTAKKLLDEYHYLHESGNFRSGVNFGLIDKETNFLIGVVVFHTNSAKYIIKGCFGIDSFKLEGFYELGRLCINPHRYEKNLTSFFLANAIKLLRKIKMVKCILTYADTDYHIGYVYQACNFRYYGLTDHKKDFFVKQNDGSFKKLQRGKCRNLDGEWRDKSEKHRYLLLFDSELKPLWGEKPYPKGNQRAMFNYDATQKENQCYIPPEVLQLELFT
jgi:hypothetical protein